MNIHLRSLSFCLLALVLIATGCTRRGDESARFSVTLPKANSSKVQSKSWGPTLPDTISQVNCYLVMIEGAEANLSDNQCKNLNGTTVAAPGIVLGGYSPGATVEVEVTPGQRTIYVMGVEALNAAACLTFRTATDSSQYSAPAIVAKATLQLSPGVNTVSLTASLSGAESVESCVGPDFPEVAAVSSVEPLWVTGGAGVIYTSLIHNDKLYVGGAFNYVGPHNGYGTELSALDGKRLPTFDSFTHKVMGDIYVAIPDGSGGWFIGGDFSSAGTEVRTRLARLNSDGSPHPWQPSNYPDGAVRALAVHDGKLLVGGAFTMMGSTGRNGLASYDLATGALTSWDPNLGSTSPEVFDMDVDSSGNLFVVGMFDDVGGVPRFGAAKFDSAGALTSWDPNLDGYPLDLQVSKVNPGRVYLCGGFNNVGAAARSKVAAVDAGSGAALSFTASVPIDGGTCQALAEDLDGNVYVGGVYLAMSSDPSMNSGPFKLGSTGTVDTSFNPYVDNNVYKMLFSAGRLYFGGEFTSVDSEKRYGLAALSASGVLTPWTSALAGTASALSMQLGRIYVGEKGLGSIGGAFRDNIAVLDLATGRATDANYGADNSVHTLSVAGDNLLIGGAFATFAGENRSGFASLNLTTGTLDANIGETSIVGSLAASSVVRSLVEDGYYVYVGSSSSDLAADPTFGYLFRVDQATGALDTTWTPQPDGSVDSLVLDGANLYAAGGFGYWTSGATGQIVKVDKDTLVADSSFISPAFDAGILHLFLNGGMIYATGNFLNVDSTASYYLARLDAATGAHDTAWVSDADGYVEHVEFSGSSIYIAGNFSMIGGVARDGVVRFSVADPSFTADSAFAKEGAPYIWAFGAHVWNDRVIVTGNDLLSADNPANTVTYFSPGIMPVRLSGSYYYAP